MVIRRKHFTILKYFFISFIFFPPLIIKVWPVFNGLDEFIKAILAIVILLSIYNVLVKRSNKYSSFEIFLVIFLALMNIQNVFVSVNFHQIASLSLPVLSYIIIMRQSIASFSEYLIGTKAYCFLITTGNLLSQLILPNGIYYDPQNSWQPYYLYANANSFVFFYVFSFGIFLIEDFYRTGHLSCSSVIYVASLIMSMLMGGTTNGFVILLGCFIVCLLSMGNGVKKILKHWKLLLAIFLTITVWMIGFNGWKSELIQNFIYTQFHENSSFVERGVIWNNAISEIKNHAIIGHGTQVANLSRGLGAQTKSAHNNYLQIALFGGVPSLIMYIILTICSFKSLTRGGSKLSYIAACMGVAYLVAYLFEQNPFYVGFYAMLMMINILSTNRISSKQISR